MSVSLSWKPVQNNGRYLDGKSRTLTALENCFGSLPIILGRGNIIQLKAMEAAGIDGMIDLVKAIYEHDEIEISSSY